MLHDTKAMLRFRHTPATARRALLAGLGLGILFDVLRAEPLGVNATAWVLALTGAAAFLARRRSAGAESGERSGTLAPLAVAAVLSLAFTWRGSPGLFPLVVLAILATLVAALVARPAQSGLLTWAGAAVTGVMGGWLGAVLAGRSAAEGAPGPRAALRPLALAGLGVVLAAPFLFVLGGLFASADPLFERAVQDVVDALDEIVEHPAVILFAGWLACGAVVSLAAIRVGRAPAVRAPAFAAPPVLVALGLVAALFLVFLAVQARALLGDRAVVETTLGLSYAEYARQGFFQLVACCAIALPPLLVADWAVPPGGRHRRTLTVIAGALLVMIVLVLVSAARRMGLYVGEYGLTEARLYASAFMVWLAALAVLFALTVLRGARDRFVLGSLVAGWTVVLGLVAVNPDATIVRANLALESPDGFDAVYASRLGADAAPLLVEAMVRVPAEDRCEVAAALLERWGPDADRDWRSWSVARARARSAVAGAGDALAAAAGGCYDPGAGGSGAGGPRRPA